MKNAIMLIVHEGVNPASALVHKLRDVVPFHTQSRW